VAFIGTAALLAVVALVIAIGVRDKPTDKSH